MAKQSKGFTEISSRLVQHQRPSALMGGQYTGLFWPEQQHQPRTRWASTSSLLGWRLDQPLICGKGPLLLRREVNFPVANGLWVCDGGNWRAFRPPGLMVSHPQRYRTTQPVLKHVTVPQCPSWRSLAAVPHALKTLAGNPVGLKRAAGREPSGEHEGCSCFQSLKGPCSDLNKSKHSYTGLAVMI